MPAALRESEEEHEKPNSSTLSPLSPSHANCLLRISPVREGSVSRLISHPPLTCATSEPPAPSAKAPDIAKPQMNCRIHRANPTHVRSSISTHNTAMTDHRATPDPPPRRSTSSPSNGNVNHRASFAENLRHSPRSQRHPSFTQAAVQELLQHPPVSKPSDPRFAGRDWRSIHVGELVRQSDVRWIELDSSVEDATKVCTPALLLLAMAADSACQGTYRPGTTERYSTAQGRHRQDCVRYLRFQRPECVSPGRAGPSKPSRREQRQVD